VSRGLGAPCDAPFISWQLVIWELECLFSSPRGLHVACKPLETILYPGAGGAVWYFLVLGVCCGCGAREAWPVHVVLRRRGMLQKPFPWLDSLARERGAIVGERNPGVRMLPIGTIAGAILHPKLSGFVSLFGALTGFPALGGSHRLILLQDLAFVTESHVFFVAAGDGHCLFFLLLCFLLLARFWHDA